MPPAAPAQHLASPSGEPSQPAPNGPARTSAHSGDRAGRSSAPLDRPAALGSEPPGLLGLCRHAAAALLDVAVSTAFWIGDRLTR